MHSLMVNSAKVSHSSSSDKHFAHMQTYPTRMLTSPRRVLQFSTTSLRAPDLSWTSRTLAVMFASTWSWSSPPAALHSPWRTHISEGFLSICSPKRWGTPALSCAPDRRHLPIAIYQQLGVDIQLEPNAWQEAQGYFGEGDVHNFQPGESKQGKSVRSTLLGSPWPPVLWPVTEPRSWGPLHPGPAGLPSSQGQPAAGTRHPCGRGTHKLPTDEPL